MKICPLCFKYFADYLDRQLVCPECRGMKLKEFKKKYGKSKSTCIKNIKEEIHKEE